MIDRKGEGMTLTELFINGRRGRELTPYQKWCFEQIENEPKKYKIVVEEDGIATVYGKENNVLN